MAEDICQEVHLLQLAACLYSRSLTALPSYSVLLKSINRDLSKQRKQLLLEQAGHLAAGFADCVYTFFSQLLLGKPAQIMNYRRLNNHSLGWQEHVCTATRMHAHPTPAEPSANKDSKMGRRGMSSSCFSNGDKCL